MSKRIVLVAAGWLVGAAATAAVATAAVNALGAGLLGPNDPPLSRADVQRELAAGSPTVAPTGTASPSVSASAPSSPPVAGDNKVLGTTGGTILARCSAGQVTLVSWSPAQGYRTDDVVPGPATAASVKFKSGRTELRVTVTCVGDQPTASTAADDHH